MSDIETQFTIYDNELGNAENWAALHTEMFLQSLSKNARNKQENIFEFLKTEVSYVKMLNITQKVLKYFPSKILKTLKIFLIFKRFMLMLPMIVKLNKSSLNKCFPI